jgi:hypothetical protein
MDSGLLFIYLFICGLFNEALSSLDYIASNGGKINNDEFEKMWKEVVVSY